MSQGESESVVGKEGLLFFGKVSTSISHDLKNALAIINESAGLLEDFAAMAARGIPLDVERLQSVASRVKRQVRRSDTIIKHMNRFARTSDKSLDYVDLVGLLQEVCGLVERLSSMAGVTFRVDDTPNPISIETAPFRLQNIIWLCIDFIIRKTDSKGMVVLQAEVVATGVNVRISPEFRLFDDISLDDVISPDRRQALLNSIGANLFIDNNGQSLVLTLPLVPAC